MQPTFILIAFTLEVVRAWVITYLYTIASLT